MERRKRKNENKLYRLKMHKYYYEAILQLRPSKEEILDFVKNQISKRKDVFIRKKATKSILLLTKSNG